MSGAQPPGGSKFGTGVLIGQKGVKYGLTVRPQPGAQARKPLAAGAAGKPRPALFGEESDEEDQGSVEAQIARQAARKQTDKKVAEMHAAAMAEDAAIFDYDSHYDAIQAQRDEPKKAEKLQRQSRYIAGLLEKAEERKQEQDIMFERQLAKERAAEDHLFGDKERFVTGAYRKKLEEQRQWKEEQRRKKEEEEANAVEKKGHMGDFYRNLLRHNVAFGAKPQPAAAEAAGAGAAGAAAAEEDQQQLQQTGEDQPVEPNWAEAEEGPAAAVPRAERPPSPQRQQPDEQRRWGEERPERGTAAAAPSAGAPPAPGKRAAEEQPADEAAAAAAPEAAAVAAAGAAERRNKEDAVAAARERYLARKRQKMGGGGGGAAE